jgi:hypothetical protein
LAEFQITCQAQKLIGTGQTRRANEIPKPLHAPPSHPAALGPSLSLDRIRDALTLAACSVKIKRTAVNFGRGLSAIGPLRAVLLARGFDFTFVLNGFRIETSTAEAIGLSPGVAEQLSVDACAGVFSVFHDRLDFDSISGLISDSNASIAMSADRSVSRSLGLLFGDLLNSALEASFLRPPFLSDLNSLSLLSIDAFESLLSEVFLPIESEDCLFRAIVGLDRSYFPLLRHVRWDLLSADALSTFASDLELESAAGLPPCESVWRAAADSLSHLLAPPAAPVQPSTGFDLTILSEFPEIFAGFLEKRFNLLWRGSRDGFSARDFHTHCDGHANTLTLIEDTRGNSFGGFTPVKWESPDSWMYWADQSLTSFLFTLKNPWNLPARKFALKSEKKDEPIACNAGCGPHFRDLSIRDRCNALPVNWTTLGFYFINDTGLAGNAVFTGAQYFQVKEIEVFEITD